ncbi:MAG TPA: malonate decarboxylase subunit alpha, partial [Xanthobacteraceae bacterium]
ADRNGNLNTGPNTEDTPTIVEATPRTSVAGGLTIKTSPQSDPSKFLLSVHQRSLALTLRFDGAAANGLNRESG